MLIDVDGTGAREAVATAWTLALYEQEFGRDLIADVYGVVDLRRDFYRKGPRGEVVAVDYTARDWNAILRALWAMLKTASDIALEAGDLAPNDAVPGFKRWVRSVGAVDMNEVTDAVYRLCNEGFFRAGAGDSE